MFKGEINFFRVINKKEKVMTELPLVSYPTCVVLVDDDKLLLEAMSDFLENNYTTISFFEPKQAVDFFQASSFRTSSLKFIRECADSDKYDVLGHLPLDLDFSMLNKMHNCLERTTEVSVMVIDYNMPGLNGFELCRQLKSLPIKKILLTGEAGDQLATAAFNEGIIDCFIRKDSQFFLQEMLHYLNALTQQYLVDKTSKLLSYLEINYPLPVSDPVFARFFKEWCIDHDIQEHYIIDQNANFLLIDKKGKKYFYIIHTERTLNNFTSLYQDFEVSNLIADVKSRKIIPYFGENKEGWQLEYSEWPKYFYKSNCFQGREKYYWIVLE